MVSRSRGPRQMGAERAVERRNCEGCADGFTLVELLVVIAVIGILCALLLPVLSRARLSGQAAYCANNEKQLMTALHLYAADYSEWLPPNPENGNSNCWVWGNMRIPSEATNAEYLTDARYAKLAPYSGHVSAIYKCPSDHTSHARTVSMNQAIGTNPDPPARPVDAPWLDGSRVHMQGDRWLTYGRLTDMTRPGPAGLWVFVDENAVSINDAAFAVDMEAPTAWVDWPGVYHDFGCNFAFADAHVETHHWADARTGNDLGDFGPEPQPNNRDIVWLQARTSALCSGAQP